ncbi:MAG: Mut7-C ubiquitin/RNAse domain-containing protein [Actinomycetota bacterium]|nr:Mut7-C ubiquitin/RNAse domain-containing protein [Actinomycetota bacterium]
MTATAKVRFYAELNDLLRPDERLRENELPVGVGETVKDLIESRGVPHAEVDLILVNGEPVDFDRRVADGDRIAVYPVFESLDISSIGRLRPDPLRITRFVLDANLGTLARYLRLCGFDTLFRNDIDDDELAATSHAEGRVLLTRDVGVLKRKVVTHGYFVRATSPRDQLVEVVRRFDLSGDLRPFTRCMRCNTELVRVEVQDVIDELEPGTARCYDEFLRCSGCGGVYWRGAHYERLLALVDAARSPAPSKKRA